MSDSDSSSSASSSSSSSASSSHISTSEDEKEKPKKKEAADADTDTGDWTNPMNEWDNKARKYKQEDKCITVNIPTKTNCWRKTFHNFIKDNAPFYWHSVSGDFEVVCKISGTFDTMYDKAGIMVRVDKKTWVLTGLELFNNNINHSTCVTKDFSDWSLAPLPEGSEKKGVWCCFKRNGVFYETFYSHDNSRWIQTSQGYFSDQSTVKVGIAGACPRGSGFVASFDQYCLELRPEVKK
jgi:regulation of enolase protein 1 (concanavalin A-like superfamily)